MKKFSVILQYLSRYKGKIVLYMIFNILSIVFGLISLGMLSPFISILLSGGKSGGQANLINTNAIGGLKNVLNEIMQHHDKSTVLLVICLLMVISTVLKNLFYYWSSYLSSPIRSATITFLRNDLYNKILQLPIGYFTEQRKGDLISRMTNDIYEIESSVVSTLEGLIKDPLTIIGYLAYMIYLSPWRSLFLLILLP
jgi:subfamily B ATP-binding cassette protein MsbA